MEQLEIKKQRQMTFAETFEFCLSSIRHRFMRSILTVCVIVLAVAFFMFLQCTNIFRNSVLGGVQQEILENRKPSRILKVLYAPTTEKDFLNMIVGTRNTPSDLPRIQKVIGFNDKEMETLAKGAFAELTYLNYFEGLTIGKRKGLFQVALTAKEQRALGIEPKWDNGKDPDAKHLTFLEGRSRLLYLTDANVFQKSTDKMREMGGIRVPGGDAEMKTFLNGYKDYVKLVGRAYAAWTGFHNAIQLKGVHQEDSAQLRQYLLGLKNTANGAENWKKQLEQNKFDLTKDEFDSIFRYLDVTGKTYMLQELLLMKEFRTAWRRSYGQNQYGKLEEKLERIDKSKSVAVFHDGQALLAKKQKQNEEKLAETNADLSKANLTAEEKRDLEDDVKTIQQNIDAVKIQIEKSQKVSDADLAAIAKDFRRQLELRDLELQLDIDFMKDSSGFSPSQLYLMCLSFLVCVVGITNAMLMSITERFREIATLKCLGATDSFILIQIVLEALIQGVIGGVAGLLLGFIVALTASTFQVGFRVFHTFDWGMIGYASLFSLLAGVLLSVLSSLYPSTKAARMAPMEAMRVE